MRTLSNDVTLTDLFCGAGGSSSGAVAAGVTVRMAANHWRLAVETHNLNHKNADHDCADISGTDPRRYPSTTILWASPECVNHSQAKGVPRKPKARQGDLFTDDAPPLPDEAADRSRATMWDVARFAERHGYRYICVENVVDARHWVMYDAWLSAMHALGYHHQAVYLNSMHAGSPADAPAPQSRDRMYVVFWQRGERAPDLRITPDAWCGPCDRQVQAVQAWKKLQPGGRYRAQYLYRCPTCHGVVEPYVLPAAAAIDWGLPGERIGDRAKPLADKTRARIAAGLRRYARPVHLEAAGNTFERPGYTRSWPVDEPLKTLHTTVTKALAVPPVLVPVEGRDGKQASSAHEVLRTMTTRNETGLAVPPMLVPAGGTWNDRAQTVTDVMRTRTTRDSEALVVPLRTHGVALPTSQPLKTFVAGNVGQALVEVPPFIAELRGGRSDHRPVSDPLATVTASGNHHALVMRNNTARGDAGQMCTPVDEPLRTLTTAGHQSLVQWSALYGYDTGLLRGLGYPLATQTTVQGDGLLHGEGLPEVDDCLFRMLEPSEIGRGMAFDTEYVVLGNKREQVRQYGNAVTPPAAALLLGRVLAALSGEEAAA